MPANIVHMLIAEEATRILISILKEKRNNLPGSYGNIASFLSNRNYVKFLKTGSILPDIPAYSLKYQKKKLIKDIFTKDTFKPIPIESIGHMMHSSPADIALRMIQILTEDTVVYFKSYKPTGGEIQGYNMCSVGLWSLIFGVLSHIAADQIIHPLINKYAGPYYASFSNAKRHMELEVLYDIKMYYKYFCELDKYKEYMAASNPFNNLFGAYCKDSFGSLFSRALIRAYGVNVKSEDCKDWMYDFFYIVEFSDLKISPYRKVIEKMKTNSELINFSKKHDFSKNYFCPAVELTVLYWLSLCKLVYEILSYERAKKIKESDIKRQLQKIEKIIKNYDLTIPLKTSTDIIREVKNDLNKEFEWIRKSELLARIDSEIKHLTNENKAGGCH